MTLSVCVPVYNTLRYLRKCLDSIVNQTYRDLEIILVDDGSTDDSGAICDEYAARDSRIKVIHTENGGQSHARNVGLDKAKGEFITFIDSDDFLINDNFFWNGVRLLRENEDVDICVFSWERRGLQGETLGRHVCSEVKWNDPYEYFSNYEPIKGKTADCFYVPVWGKVYRRKLFKGVRFQQGKVFEDVAINADLFLMAKGIMLNPEIVYGYSENPAGTMSNLNSKKKNDAVKSSLYVLERMLDKLADKSLPAKYFAKVFYETCVIGYANNIKLDDSIMNEMDRLFKLIKHTEALPIFTKWLIGIFGVEKARKIYVGLMKVKNNRFLKRVVK